MKKTILITGATDGIGFETARLLAEDGHCVLLHGRNEKKLATVCNELTERAHARQILPYLADLSHLGEAGNLVRNVYAQHRKLDVLINNAGLYATERTINDDDIDVRFVVNTIAPYFLAQRLSALLGKSGRVINVASAAQSPVDLQAFRGRKPLSHEAAYAQSKLALIMWTRLLAGRLDGKGPSIISVNPGSLLASKMVKEAFGTEGRDIRIGASILVRAAVSHEFGSANGRYFDNDVGHFSSPHPDALDAKKAEEVVCAIENFLASRSVPAN